MLTTTRKRAAPAETEPNHILSSTRNHTAHDQNEPTEDPSENTLPDSTHVSAEGSATADGKRQKLLETHSADEIELALKFLAQAKK